MSFAILFVLNILYDVSYDVIYKHVYTSDGFDWIASETTGFS